MEARVLEELTGKRREGCRVLVGDSADVDVVDAKVHQSEIVDEIDRRGDVLVEGDGDAEEGTDGVAERRD